MLKVGITGGIGSGKTTVCKIFEVLGVPVYYADERAKYILQHDTTVVHQVKKLLGENAYQQGVLNKAFIAEKVFADKNLLERYNQIVHPAVASDTEKWILLHQKRAYILKEAALLVETGAHLFLDKLIVVTAPLELRISRVMQRDNATREAVEARIRHQMPEEEKVKLADYIIDNSGKESLIEQARFIHQDLLKLSAGQ